MANESWGKRVWRLMTPILIYMGICYIVELVAGMYWGMTLMEDYVTEDLELDIEAFTDVMTELILEYSVLLQSIGALIAIFFLIRMYFKDYRKRRFVFNKKSVKPACWVLLIPAGILASLAGNLLLNVTDAAELSEGFQEASLLLFSGDFIFQVIGLGIIIPICEELVYRGLIYMRMRQYMDVNAAIGLSALVFGFAHGNIVQGIYGFLVGIMFAYVYEKYGSLKAPIAAHISANLLSLVLSAAQLSFENSSMMMTLGSAALVCCLIVVICIDRTVSAERIYFGEQ